MKKTMNKVAAMATILSVFSMVLTACGPSGETLSVKSSPNKPIVVDNSYETSLVTNSQVNNNGIKSIGTITGVGSITTDLESENPIEYTLDANAEANVTLRQNVVTVSAENAGVVSLTEEGQATASDLTTNEEAKKSYSKTFSFSDGQAADAIYAYAYTNVKLSRPIATPHVEITNVTYIDYTAAQIAENQYKIVMHFRADYKTFGVKNATEGSLDLYPEYIQEVEAAAPQWSYEEEVKYHFNEQDARLKMEWRLTRNDGKKFSIWALVAEFYRPSGHDELHVTSGAIVSSTEEILDTKETVLAAVPHAERCFFTKQDGAFTISSTAFGKHIVRTWMMESGVDMPGMDITALMQVGTEVSFTDPETGVSFSKTFRGELKVSEEKDVNLHKEGVNVQGRFFPYIHTHQLTVESTLYGPDNYVYKFSHTAETNLYKVQ